MVDESSCIWHRVAMLPRWYNDMYYAETFLIIDSVIETECSFCTERGCSAKLQDVAILVFETFIYVDIWVST